MSLSIAGFALPRASNRTGGIPAILIVQEAVKGKHQIPHDLDLARVLSNDFEAGEKVIPIQWSLDDSVFRSAVESHKLKLLGYHVPVSKALQAGQLLRCDYVMIIYAQINQAELLTQADLYKNGNRIWHDPPPRVNSGNSVENSNIRGDKISASQRKQIENSRLATEEKIKELKYLMQYRITTVELSGKSSFENTLQSVARTYISLLNEGPLKTVAVVPIIPNVGPAPGETSALDSVPIIPGPPSEISFENQLKNARASGHNDEVIAVLRDGVDSAPFDVLRRKLLIRQLIAQGLSSEAAQESMDASILMPKSLSVHLLAASAFLAEGKIPEAVSQAELAQTVDPKNAEARIIQGRAALVSGDLKGATELIQSGADLDSSSKNLSYLAIVQAISDNPNATQTMMLAVKKGKIAPYSDLVPLVDPTFKTISSQLRNLFSFAIIRSTTVNVPVEINQVEAQAAALESVLQLIPNNNRFEKSQNMRLLALSLLEQSSSELASYVKSRSDDDLANARIGLGQAIQTYKDAVAQFKVENQGDETSNSQSTVPGT